MGMLGHRRGGAVELFAAGGHLVISGAAPVVASLIGLVIHGVWMLLWSLVVVAIARHRGALWPLLAATAVGAVAFLATLIVPSSFIGPVATLTTGERALVHVVLAVSLMIGMRLAPGGDVRSTQRVSTSEERWLV